MANKQHIFSGAGAPGSAPTEHGHHYVDTTNDEVYISAGTAAAADWKKVGDISFPLLAPLNTQAYGFTGGDNDTYMWSSGDGNISFSANGFLRLEVEQNTVEVTGPLNVSGNISAANYPPTGSADTLAYYDGSGDLITLPGYNVNTRFGLDITQEMNPNGGGGGFNFSNTALDFIPLQNSPAETWAIYNHNINIDPTSTGFTFGTGGQAISLYSLNFNHQGTSNIGSLEWFRSTANLGNGTDPIDVNGLTYSLFIPSFNAGVSVLGPVQGFIFNPAYNATSIVGGSSYVLGFGDVLNAPSTTFNGGYKSFVAGPSIGSIANNTNYVGMDFNSNISNFLGNASVTVVAVGGNFGTFGVTGNYIGVSVNPTITAGVNAAGLVVNMSGVTASGNVDAAQFTGDVSITGDLTFSGALAIGALNAFAAQAVVDGGGSPATIHGLISSPTVANGLTIANIDTIGVNTAMLVNIGTGCTLTSAGFGLGLSALALPAIITIGAGSTIDNICGGAFALSMGGGAGTVDLTKGCRSVFIGDGTTTVNKFYAMSCETLGLGATENWGVHADSVEYNFMQSLKIGGSTGSTDKVTGVSNGLEFAPTKAFVATNVTNAQEAALTAVNGMIVYNTTTNKFRGYENGAWVDMI